MRAIRYLTEEPTVSESRIFLNGLEITGNPPELRTAQRGPLMPVYLTDVRSERAVIIQVNWIGGHADRRVSGDYSSVLVRVADKIPGM
jgi:hypothetical protein